MFCREAYIKGKKERPPFVPPSAEEQAKAESEKAEPKKIIPPELSCPVCHDLIKDAVLVKCCTNSGCDECKSSGKMSKIIASNITILSCLWSIYLWD